MTHIASRGMEEVPCSFSRSFVKFEGHMGRKIDDFDPISAYRMIVFKVFHSISTLKVRQAIYKVTRPAAAIKSLRCALSSIQSDFM